MKKVSFISLVTAGFCFAVALSSSSCNGGCNTDRRHNQREEHCGPPCEKPKPSCVPCDPCEKPVRPPCKKESCPQPSQCLPDECSTNSMDDEETSDVGVEETVSQTEAKKAEPVVVPSEKSAAVEAAKPTLQGQRDSAQADAKKSQAAPLSELRGPVPENAPIVKKDSSESHVKLEVRTGN